MPKKNGKSAASVRVSFLPEEAERPEHAVRKRLAILIIFVVTVAAAGLGLAGYLRFRTGVVGQDIAALYSGVNADQEEVALLEAGIFENEDIGRLSGFAKSALNSHIAAEQVLQVLEDTAVPGFIITQLAVDTNGTAIVSARGQDLEIIAQQLTIWYAHPQIDDVSVSGVSAAADRTGTVIGMNLSAALRLDRSVFKWNP